MMTMREAMSKVLLRDDGPVPKTFKPAPERRYYAGSMKNFLAQQAQVADLWQKLLDDGYVEVAPGILRRRDG